MEKMIKEYSFSVAWGWDRDEATEERQPFKTDDEARAARDTFAKLLKSKGYKIKKKSLSNQLRQYWGWLRPCGIMSNVYYIEVYAP